MADEQILESESQVVETSAPVDVQPTPVVEQASTPVDITPAPEPASQIDPFLSQASQMLGGQWSSKDQFLGDVSRMRAELDRQRELAEIGRQYLPYQSELQQYFQQKNQPPAPKAEEPKTQAWRHGLEDQVVAKALREYGQYDEQRGRFIPAPESPQWAKDNIEKYQDWFDRHKSAMFSDKFDDYIEQAGFVRANSLEQLKEDIRNELRSEFQTREAQAVATRTFQEVAPKVYQMDERGQPVRDPRGQPLYTEWGRTFHAAVNQLEADGITDPVKVRRYAEAIASQNEYARAVASQKIEAEQRKKAGIPPQISSPTTRIAPIARDNAAPPPNTSLNALLKHSGWTDSDWQDMQREWTG